MSRDVIGHRSLRWSRAVHHHIHMDTHLAWKDVYHWSGQSRAQPLPWREGARPPHVHAWVT